MAYQQHQPQQVVSKEVYDYALSNFRIAHEKVEQQRGQLEEQERQVAILAARIALLEGNGPGTQPQKRAGGGNTVDDFSIKNAASKLDKLINRWAAEIIAQNPQSIRIIHQAILADLDVVANPDEDPTPMQVQSLLRHALSQTISEGIINCLIVTNSSEANVQLTRIHEHIFARDPTVAGVWRRQTFSASVEHCTPEMCRAICHETGPSLLQTLGNIPISGGVSIMESAYEFSKMLHGSLGNAFYQAFVPELGSVLYPQQIELVKRCLMSETQQLCRVGSTIFPGLVKVTRGAQVAGQGIENIQTVVRRAQVICDCALGNTPVAIA